MFVAVFAASAMSWITPLLSTPRFLSFTTTYFGLKLSKSSTPYP